jgi:hypothetical protein
LSFAAIGIALSQRFDEPELDGAASLIIGLQLAGVAVALILESRGLLIGEGIRPETARGIRSIALGQPKVRDVGRVLSMYIGPDDVLVTMDLNFDDGTAAADGCCNKRGCRAAGALSPPDDQAPIHRGRRGASATALESAGFDASPS